MKIKAVGYTRVSTKKQVEGNSLKYQKEALKNYCKQHNLELVKVFSDEGISAYRHRPKFVNMFDFVKNRNINYVLTYSITRFGRSTQDLLFHITKLQNEGVNFVSVKEQFDLSTKIGKLMLTMLSAIADFEGETIRERMEAGREYAKKHGVKFGRPKAEIDWDKVKDLRKYKVSWSKTAKMVGVSTPTLISRAKDEGIL